MPAIKHMTLPEVNAELAFIALSGEVLTAALEWRARQARRSKPSGRWDNGGRFYPSAEERRPCCAGVRDPSRNWPRSLWRHVLGYRHVAECYGVDPAALRRAASLLDRRAALLGPA